MVIVATDAVPASCKAPTMPTGDIVCYQQFEVLPSQNLTFTWFEVSRQTSLSDNAGIVTFDVFATLENADTDVRFVRHSLALPRSLPRIRLCCGLCVPHSAAYGGRCAKAAARERSTRPL